MKHYLGIIGCGGMGHYHYMNAPKSTGLEVAAVYDILPNRVKELETETVRGYHDLDSFLKDDKVDIVTIAVPTISIKTMRSAHCGPGKTSSWRSPRR